MALRLAGEEYSLVQGLDPQGFVREVIANDALPGLIIDQKGSGRLGEVRQSETTVVRRLLALVPGRFVFRGQAAHLREPLKSDATDYAYGTNHPLLAAHYGQGPLGYARVQVFGAAGMEETSVWSEMPLLGERVLQQHDLNLDTQQKASDRCQEIVRTLELEALFGETIVPVNCGQELYDLVGITDQRAGLSAAKRRVAGLKLEYRRDRPPRYLLHLALGGV